MSAIVSWKGVAMAGGRGRGKQLGFIPGVLCQEASPFPMKQAGFLKADMFITILQRKKVSLREN